MAYSLGIRCLSEFIGMIMVIYVGESALANELLPSTKGHGMGWGWTVWTFGMAFLIPLQTLSKVSAKLNPAMCLAQLVWGNISGVDFVCLSLAEVAGALVGKDCRVLFTYCKTCHGCDTIFAVQCHARPAFRAGHQHCCSVHECMAATLYNVHAIMQAALVSGNKNCSILLLAVPVYALVPEQC